MLKIGLITFDARPVKSVLIIISLLFLYKYKMVSMKSLFAILLAIIALNVYVVYVDDVLPKIAPVDEPAPPPLDAPAS